MDKKSSEKSEKINIKVESEASDEINSKNEEEQKEIPLAEMSKEELLKKIDEFQEKSEFEEAGPHLTGGLHERYRYNASSVRGLLMKHRIKV